MVTSQFRLPQNAASAPTIHPRRLFKAFSVQPLAGTTLESYQLAVYSAAVAVVFPVVFFRRTDPLTGTVLAFSTYAVGYVSRPVAGSSWPAR